MKIKKIIELTDPALNIQEASLEYRSLDVSSVSMTMEAPSLQSRCPYEYNDIYRVLYRGRVVLEGPCLAPLISAADMTWQVTICDYWRWLAETPYLGKFPAQVDTGHGRPTPRSLTAKQIIGYSLGGEQEEVKTTMSDVLSAARSAGILPTGIDVRVSASEMIPYVTTSATYASVLVNIHDWVPNSVSFFDYSAIDRAMALGDPAAIAAAEPVLVIADPGTLPTVDLPLSAVDLTDCSIQARPELVPPLVAVIGTEVDSCGWVAVVNSICPAGGNLQQPGNVIIQLEGGSLPYTVADMPPDPGNPEEPENPNFKPNYSYNRPPTMIIRGADIPSEGPSCAKFWGRHAPVLAEIPGLVFGAQSVTAAQATGQEGKSYSKLATDYELVEGLISNKCAGIRWCKTIVKQQIAYPGVGCPARYGALFPHVRPSGQRWGVHTLELITTNMRSKAYYSGGDYQEFDPPDPGEEDEEDDPPKPGIITPTQSSRYNGKVASYYKNTRAVPHDGSFALLERREDIGVGVRINILGGYPDWETMAAIVQSVSIDPASDKMSVTIGPAKHLRLDKSEKAARSLVDQVNGTKENTQPAANDVPSFSWDYEFDGKKNKDQSPGIGPWAKYIPPAGAPPLNGDFAVRALMEDGDVAGYQVHKGSFLSSATGQTFPCGEAEWTDCGDAEVWANLEVDNGGVPQRAYFSNARTRHEPWHPEWTDDGKIDMLKTKPGYYSYRVASIRNGEVVQHHSGPITVSYYTFTFAF